MYELSGGNKSGNKLLNFPPNLGKMAAMPPQKSAISRTGKAHVMREAIWGAGMTEAKIEWSTDRGGRALTRCVVVKRA